ncbi:MAG: hypothetical protein LW650_13485 [Planctomycetaceae bacterium]|jgi:hypothetical protein|nr:hypothetical protein [Phycisphaerales bacterium]MCE2654418.1 hypothetical protein [Planctomycetaceae bacterium]
MKTTHTTHEHDGLPEDVRSVATRLDALARTERTGPDAGFEDRLLAGLSIQGSAGLKLVGGAPVSGERPRAVLTLRRWAAVAAAVAALAGGAVALQSLIRPTGGGMGPVAIIEPSSASTFDSVLESLALLDDQTSLSGDVQSLASEADSLSSAIGQQWDAGMWSTDTGFGS